MIIIAAIVMLLSSAVMAQPSQSYPLKPFICPQGQFIRAFNPVTIGLPGFFCETVIPPFYGRTGVITCTQSVIVTNGIVENATSGSCH